MASVFYASTDELATLSNTFLVDGVATDPTTVTLTVTTPSQVSTSSTWAGGQVTRTGLGAFAKDIACTEAGEWAYRWVGTGAADDTQAGTWTVWDASLGKLYATVAALKSRVGITDAADDYELHAACFAASRALEQYCQRIFYRTAPGTVRTFEPSGFRELTFGPYNDLVAIESLAGDYGGTGVWDTVWSTADYQLSPLNPAAAPEVRPYTGLRAVRNHLLPQVLDWGRTDRVQITGTWGWPAVPVAIRQAALVLAAEIFRGKDAPFGIVSYGDMGIARVRDNPMVARLANGYRLTPVGVA